MKATRITHKNFGLKLLNDEDELRVIVDVWKIPEPNSESYPDGLKFSIIAFLVSNPSDVVLLDCHPPKGPHFHLDGKQVSFEWSGLDEAEKLFWNLVEKKFGQLEK